jgi:hypothetical protein
MRDLAAKRERFMRDPLPIRLGGLAANLARVESFSTHEALRDAVGRLIQESSHFIEWTVLDADQNVRVELAELQRQLTEWQHSLADIWPDTARRASVAYEARNWSQRVLAASGILE